MHTVVHNTYEKLNGEKSSSKWTVTTTGHDIVAESTLTYTLCLSHTKSPAGTSARQCRLKTGCVVWISPHLPLPSLM